MSGIRAWLAELGLDRYAENFAADDVDLDVLPLLDDGDLERLGLSLGHRKLVLRAAAKLAQHAEATANPGASALTASPAVPVPERRQLTVLFCDLVGSTELSARLDPEDLQQIIGEYQRSCAKVIEQAQGYVAKYMGDGVLAYFGYPRALADAADRAIHAALGLVEAIPRGAPQLQLAVRVGVATGEVVVGEQIGVESSRERAVVGDAPNLAARLQAVARPGQILVADLTRQLARRGYAWSGPHAMALKGFSEPLPVWEAIGEPAASVAPAGGPGAATVNLIGRRSEMELLGDRLEMAGAGDGRVVVLLGEAGIGKSAVSRALVEQARRDGIACTTFAFSPFHQSSELHPFVVQIEREAGVARGAPAAENLDRLRLWLARDGSASATDVALFGALLALPMASDEPLVDLSDLTPQALRAKTLNLLESRLLRSDRLGTALLVFEDAHWMDPTSAELLARCVDRIGGRRLMLLVTARPELEVRWTRHPYVTLLTLSRLGQRDAAGLAAAVLPDRALPEGFVEQLLRRAEGNPLFIEELAKSVVEALRAEDGAATDALHLDRLLHVVPTSLRDLLAERLDRLGPAREMAQAAAVIGQEFDERLLEAITGSGEQGKRHLAQLIESQVIVWRGAEMATSYAFRHALIQEAAYQSLLKRERRGLHQRIAESLERGVVPELAEREPERIAWHYAEAGIVDRAIDGWHQSGIRAAQRSANIEAIRQLSDALALLRQQPAGPARAGTELSLLVALGPALQATGGWGALKVREVYDSALALARETGRAAELYPALWGRWLIAHASGEAPFARELLAQLAEIADELGNPDLRLQLYHAAGSTHCTDAQFSSTMADVEACRASYDLERHRHQAMRYGGHDPCVCTTCIGALTQFITGRDAPARRWSDEALDLATRIAHAPSVAHAQIYRAELCQIRGEVDASLALADSVLAIGTEKGLSHYVAWAKMTRGWARTRQGDADGGLGEIEDGLAALRRTGVRYHLPHRLAMRAQAYAAAGRAAKAVDGIEEALASVDLTGERWYEAEVYRGKANLLMEAGADAGAIEALYAQAVALAAEQGARRWECRARIDLAHWLARRSRIAAARDVLAPTQQWGAEVDLAERRDAAELLVRLPA